MKHILILLMMVIIISCNNDTPEKLQNLIQQKLLERKTIFLQNKYDDCKRSLMSRVQLEVDSTLSFGSKYLKFDSITVPHDTNRPLKPEISFPQFNKPERPKSDSIIIK
ncbi:MAG: hypothetical protein IPK88_08210 [Saprospiraceae bacterium]|jgi:hypothetical protein|nr:hypothetical protein [Candidatus Defluviibacterium haderslevense]MCC7025422.1 hypothetical protein [Saprospiraceae bacterium]MCI1265748.1 hypothetical protein [Saprospiraceae bacterium]